MGQRRSRRESTHDEEAVRVAGFENDTRIGREHVIHHGGRVEIRLYASQASVIARRRYTHDGVRVSVQTEVTTDDIGVPTKGPPPISVRDHHHRVSPRSNVVIGGKCSPYLGRDAQQLKVIAAYSFTEDRLYATVAINLTNDGHRNSETRKSVPCSVP